MSNVYTINEETMIAIGDAIREKTNKTEALSPLNMPDEIRSIDGGSDYETVSNKALEINNYNKSSNTSYPTTKAVVDYVAEHGGGGSVDTDKTLSIENVPADARLLGML